MVNMSVPTLLSFLVPSFTFLSPRLSHLFTSPGRHRSIFVILSTLSYFFIPFYMYTHFNSLSRTYSYPSSLSVLVFRRK